MVNNSRLQEGRKVRGGKAKIAEALQLAWQYRTQNKPLPLQHDIPAQLMA